MKQRTAIDDLVSDKSVRVTCARLQLSRAPPHARKTLIQNEL